MSACLLLIFYLVAYGLGPAPLKKDLFDTAGTGHPKTLRPLQFGFGVHWFGATVHEEKWVKDSCESFNVSETYSISTIIPMTPECSIPCIYLLLASESSLSKIDRRAWAPMLRGRVCDLTSSRLLSPTCPKDLSLLTSPSLQDMSAEGSDNAKTILPILKDVSVHVSPVMLKQPGVGHRLSGGWICFLCTRQRVTVNHIQDVSNRIACVCECVAHLEGREIQELW